MKEKVTSFYKDAAAAVNSGLRKYIMSVFSHMCIGLGITGVVAFAVSSSLSIMHALFATGLQWLVLLAPLGIVIYLSSRLTRMSALTATTWFYLYAACLGISLAPIFIVYTGESIASTFFISSSMFLSMVIYGYSTEKDLTQMGSFLFMGLIGIIIASVINIFIGSSTTNFVISILGVLIFTGLTVFDIQRIKSYYLDGDSLEISDKKAIFGALSLYMDFINLFLYILRLMGSRRN